MSLDKFLMALDRFVSRRGLPHTVYSDNANTVQAARRELAEICTILNDPRHPTTSHIEASPGNSLPHGQLGGEDGGSVW